MPNRNIKSIAILLGLTFFILGIITLPRYGINWDTINHLPRGQAYLQYYLTGKKDYSNLPELFNGWQKESQWYWQDPDVLRIKTDLAKGEVPSRSLYQNDATTFNWFMEHDGAGHPPLSDILSSFFNRVLFGKLRLINDIDSYRVYGIFLAASLVGLVFWWTSKVYGGIAGFVAALSLSLYPLFWAESHFNTEKDIPETAFWGFFLFSFWRGIKKRNWKWILLSGVFCGLALGTKFNILFSVFVIAPWFFAYLMFDIKTFSLVKLKKFIVNKKLIISLIMIPIIAFTIFVASWPYLWPNLLERIEGVIGFYKTIGLTQNVNNLFLGPFGINTYPLQWIAYTTPLIILFLFLVGVVVAVQKISKEKDKISLLFLLWFSVPVIRIIWPGTTVYGGVRQIMEYIPAMAILAGLGGGWIVETFSKKISRNFVFLIVILPFVFLTHNLYKIHPNENVYFNSLVGGLAGAKEKNIPFWGFSFGSPYRQAASWINKNAEEGSNVVYTYDLIPNIPRIWLRTDLNLHNANRSGYLRQGEYAMSLVFQGTKDRSYYDSYLEKFIEPVYEVKVDGVSIVKVWKNDDEHLKTPWIEKIEYGTFFEKTDFGLRFDLKEEKKLSRLEIYYNERGCSPMSSGYVRISTDSKNWQTLYGSLPRDWLIPVLGQQPKDGKFIEPFVGQKARYVDVVVSPSDTCLTKINNFKVYVFENEELD